MQRSLGAAGWSVLLCAAGILILLGSRAAAVTGRASETQAAQDQLPVPPGAEASDHFDPVVATNAYLATVPADKRARSDAYFEGGYWLILWNFLASAAVYMVLLGTAGLSLLNEMR